jgi:DNA polymerase-3 subunit alpha (Gram-positive type)
MDNFNTNVFSGLISGLSMESQEIINNMSFKKAVVHSKSQMLYLHFDTYQYIDPIKLVALENDTEKLLTDFNGIRVRITSDSEINPILMNFDSYWIALVISMKRDIASCNGLIDSCKCSLTDDTLHLKMFHPMSFAFFSNNETKEYIRQRISDLSGIELNLKIEFKEKHIDIVDDNYFEEKQKEERELLKEAIINKSKIVNGNTSCSKLTDGMEVLFGKEFKDDVTPIKLLKEELERIAIQGMIFGFELRPIKGDKTLLSIDVTDHESSVTCKAFIDKKRAVEFENKISIGKWVRVRGELRYDKYTKENSLIIGDLISIPGKIRQDNAEKKRVELHLHTNMSSMDAVTSVKDFIIRAANWGHSALAITDHGVAQAFPEAYEISKKHGIKVIYGVEAYLINDCKSMVLNCNDKDFDQSYVVLDIETTGLNAKLDKIIEVAAVRIVNDVIVDTFHSMIDPEIDIPYEITKLTGITTEMVKSAPKISYVLNQFHKFLADDCLVAHNAPFDIGFLKEKFLIIGVQINNPIIDTLSLSRELLKDLKKHNLGAVSEYFRIPVNRHHRALDDVKATAAIYMKFKKMLEQKGVRRLSDVNSIFAQMTNLNSLESNHAVILVKNQIGLRNMYKLISMSHMDYFYRKPRIPKSILAKHKEGLLIGSGCNSGELFKAVQNGTSKDELKDIATFYDYLEIQPIGNNEHLVSQGKVKGVEDLKKINSTIVELGETLNKPVVATGDVHYLEPTDDIFRSVLSSVQGLNEKGESNGFFFKTTDEMLEEFEYLGKKRSWDVVVNAPSLIAQSIESLKPIPDGFYPPKIPLANQAVEAMAIEKTKLLYGEPLPDIVSKRLKKELDAIIGNDFAVLYYIAHKLVKKSLSDGYLVGSRGSVGSSLVATMIGITEVNPLPPHYLCPSCKHSDFAVDVSVYACGVDLPNELCPRCGVQYKKEGFDIPFEVFMGFDGDKVPDIDLNFSGEYQPIAHKYAEEIFGKGRVFRAGTIGTIAEKTAFGFVKKYLEDTNKIISNTELKRLAQGCTGVKRTTGQHPGGVIVVPETTDIYNFTPIQFPADDKSAEVVTTHFDYHSISSRLIKLDILGHDDPTVIRMMEELTGINAMDIPIDDRKTMAIFSGIESLGVSSEELGCSVGTIGIPEFGTKFVRQMLLETKPTTFSELVRISGLSHGTDVWLNNAQELVRNKTAHLSEVISTRDDIMVYLIYKGINPGTSFDIMETVRKGKQLPASLEDEMRGKNVPDWFIESCKKIKYMFPKAHAVAYVLMAFRIAYFKVYHPKAFYASYLTVKANDFDENVMMSGKNEVSRRIKELEAKGNNMSNKEKNLLTVLEVILEMYLRGIKMLSLDLYKSDATKFLVTDEGLRPPFNVFPGVGINAAKSIVEARLTKQFISIEDLSKRGKISKAIIETLKKSGCLEGLSQNNQLSIF